VILFNFRILKDLNMKRSFLATTVLALLASSVATLAHAQTAEIKGTVAEGKAKNAMCIGCHGIPGYKASFPSVYSAPMIAGQNAKYIESALLAYQKGERKHPTMKAVAASLSAKDMADLGAYYASLK
jgi:cytochrome c553